MTKEGLGQYGNLVKEYGEVKEKLWAIRGRIERIEARIRRIEGEGVVKDKVYGGEGGIRGFVIEGYAFGDYSEQRTKLLREKLALQQTQATLDTLVDQIGKERNEIEEFIAHVDNSYMRRILNYRLIKGMQWEDIAIHMGGGNTAIGVRVAYHRFIENYFGCST